MSKRPDLVRWKGEGARRGFTRICAGRWPACAIVEAAKYLNGNNVGVGSHPRKVRAATGGNTRYMCPVIAPAHAARRPAPGPTC